jgi:hypothetical protein
MDPDAQHPPDFMAFHGQSKEGMPMSQSQQWQPVALVATRFPTLSVIG